MAGMFMIFVFLYLNAVVIIRAGDNPDKSLKPLWYKLIGL